MHYIMVVMCMLVSLVVFMIVWCGGDIGGIGDSFVGVVVGSGGGNCGDVFVVGVCGGAVHHRALS